LLSDRLKGKRGLQTPWPTDDPGLTRAERREVQARLEQHGYDVGGKHDGVMGTKTREAIKAYKSSVGLKADSRAGQKVLELLRGGR
jgi:peptidoglycan hydrolase-like protein with peptidoglycan-binding domain